MNKLPDFTDLSMDEIVFENRNKLYGAYALRKTYNKWLLKALCLSVGVFVFGLFTPKIANAIGLFDINKTEELDTVIYEILPAILDEKVEEIIPETEQAHQEQSASERFTEIIATDKPTTEILPTQDELEGKVISNVTNRDSSNHTPDNNPLLPVLPGGGDFGGIVVNVDQAPTFIGGEEALHEFLTDNLVFPLPEKSIEASGVVVLSFVVNKDGSVTHVKVYKTSGYKGFDDEAIRVIKLANGKFRAGKKDGRPVNSICQIPITFEPVYE